MRWEAQLKEEAVNLALFFDRAADGLTKTDQRLPAPFYSNSRSRTTACIRDAADCC